LVLAQKQYEELQALNKINNFNDYEKVFESMWRKLGKEVLLEADLSYLPVERRKKTYQTWANQYKQNIWF
jgi:hypothetical protein